jgi:hypothetical protein
MEVSGQLHAKAALLLGREPPRRLGEGGLFGRREKSVASPEQESHIFELVGSMFVCVSFSFYCFSHA